jgi:hypothetical protein
MYKRLEGTVYLCDMKTQHVNTVQWPLPCLRLFHDGLELPRFLSAYVIEM